MLLSNAISEFVLSCKLRMLSEHTLKAYQSDLGLFKSWSRQTDVKAALTALEITAWRIYLDKRSFAATTIKRRLASLQSLTKWLEREALLDSDPFREIDVAIKLPRRLPRNLQRSDLSLLLEKLKRISEFNSFSNLLIWLTVELILTTGIRIAEACSITLNDIDLEGRVIRVDGKGSRERQVFLIDDELINLLEKYLTARARRTVVTDHLLITAKSSAASPDYIRRKLHRIVESTNITGKITPHMLRHTAATQLLECGVDIRFVQRLLGHSSIATTEIYTHVSNVALRNAILSSDLRRQWR